MTDETAQDPELADVTYADAVDELESILEALDADTVDVDDLARQVRRAGQLIRLCRDRITGARLEVEQVVAELDALDPEPEPLDDPAD